MTKRAAILTRRRLIAAAGALAASPAMAQTARPRVRLETEKGVIVVELADDKAPITVANFLRYVDSKRMDGAVFYRASKAPGAPTVGFVQAHITDPAKLYPPIAHESTTMTGLKHIAGALSMPRLAPGTAQSEFTIMCSDAPYMDADPAAPGDNLGYAVFGQVVEGMDVVRAILAMDTTGTAQNAVMQGEIIDPPVKILSARRV
jgi:peptidyl-prolyl cis-trans isomerase A (cyclophilin A)